MELDTPARAFRGKKGCGWKSAINQIDLAGWKRACLMRCGVLGMKGLVPISVLQSVPVSSRDAVRVLKKLHLFSAGQQKGTEFRQRYKWCIHVRRQQVLQPKVRFPNFISPSFVLFPSLQWLQQKSEIQIMHVFFFCGCLICGNEDREYNPVLPSPACYLFQCDQCANESNQRPWEWYLILVTETSAMKAL